jgi:transcriptional regulator with XRE-family HTH domain
MLNATIWRLRQSQGWTLRQLAGRVGIHYAYLSQIERGKATPSRSLLERLAAAFGLSYQQLMHEAKEGLPSPRKLRSAAISRLTRAEREVRERLARFYLEEVKGRRDFSHSGWIPYSKLEEIGSEFDSSRILQNMLRLGLIQTKREGEILHIRLNPEHNNNSKILEEAQELNDYRLAIEEDRTLEGKATPYVQKLGQLICAEADSFHYVVIPGLSEMLLRANIRLDLDEESLEGLSKSSLHYHEYYTYSSCFLPWVAAYTSMMLQRNSEDIGESQIKEVLQDAKTFYEKRGIEVVAKELAIGERNYLEAGRYLFKALGLEYLKMFERWALEILAFCWVAYIYLDSLNISSYTIEGEIQGLAQPLMGFALQLIAKGKSEEDFQRALNEPIERLRENVEDKVEDKEVIRLGRLQDILQFPWGL